MQPPNRDVPKLVTEAIDIWTAGVDAVNGKHAVINAALDPLLDPDPGGDMFFYEHQIRRDSFDRIFVIGAGKASAAMAEGLQHVLSHFGLMDIVHASWINVPENMAGPSSVFYLHPARPAGINLPTQCAVDGTERILQIVENMTERDLCFCLISGGGSALLASPIPPVTLDDKRKLTEKLSALGADIRQLNTVRKNISQVKGGRLAGRCRDGQMISLIISDIIGDPIELIASGPTVKSDDSRDEALAILRQYDPDQILFSENIYSALREPCEMPQSIASVTNVIVANNAIAVDAAGVQAVASGYDYIMTCDLNRNAEALEVGHKLADWIINAAFGKGPNCLVSGGEPVVRLCAQPGDGGRNQQVIIEAIDRLCSELGEQLNDIEFVLLSAGTDGEDGTTQAAGAWLDNELIERAKSKKTTIQHHRKNNDSYRLFQQLGNLFVTGPTCTNVCDLRVALVNRQRKH